MYAEKLKTKEEKEKDVITNSKTITLIYTIFFILYVIAIYVGINQMIAPIFNIHKVNIAGVIGITAFIDMIVPGKDEEYTSRKVITKIMTITMYIGLFAIVGVLV